MPGRLPAPAPGTKFNRWTFIERLPDRGVHRDIRWRCVCDCGKEGSTGAYEVRSGRSKSCGCLLDERRPGGKPTHGKSHTRTYKIWQGIRKRCNNPSAAQYAFYGGRGIRVCERWNAFEAFLADMGEAPDGLEIDRIDCNKDYAPTNCRWASRAEQVRNMRRNVHIEYCGQVKCASDWAKEYGLHPGALRYRLLAGWSMERALTAKLRPHVRKNKRTQQTEKGNANHTART
jgi:hypothetical protein